VSALDSIEHQLDLYQEDLCREFDFRITDVDGVLRELEERGQQFLDETVRIGRIFDLIRKTCVKEEFESKVVADAPDQIEQKVGEIIDWMVSAELRQWQALDRRLTERRAHHADRVVGSLGSFDQDRRQLLDTLGRAAHRTVDSYKPDVEANRLADSVQNSVAGLAVIEVGAIGLGAIVAALATTTLVDVTGILAAGFVVAMGLCVLPARRFRAKTELNKRIGELRSRLTAALKEQFEHESERSLVRIREAVAPYTRFVRAERERFIVMRFAYAPAADACLLRAYETHASMPSERPTTRSRLRRSGRPPSRRGMSFEERHLLSRRCRQYRYPTGHLPGLWRYPARRRHFGRR